MKYVFKALTFLSLTISLSFAGQEGGGGAGVVCKKQGKITSVKLLDLYDSELNEGSVIPRSILPMNQQITNILKKTDKYFRYDLNSQISSITFNFLPENVTQVQPYDLGDNPVVIEDNCTIEWLAFYKDTSKSLQIVTKYFNKMSPTDQAALIIHEAVYRIRRENLNDKSSYKTRRIVAAFLASNILPEELAELTFDMRTRLDEVIVSDILNTITLEVEEEGPFGSRASVCRDSKWKELEMDTEIISLRTGYSYVSKVHGICRYLTIHMWSSVSYRIFMNGVFFISGSGELGYNGGRRVPVRSLDGSLNSGFTFTIYPPGLK